MQPLPSLSCWHTHSVRSWQDSRGTVGPAVTVQTHARKFCHVHPAKYCHSQAYARSIVTTAAAEASDQAPANLGPSPFDRLLAVSMYCLPLYEGVWRLSVVCVRIAQYHTVNWLVWANRHGQELRSGSDQVTVHAVIYACQLLCQELSTISRWLLQWGSNDPSIVVRHARTHSLSAASGHLGSFVYMAVVSSLASAAFTHQRHRPAKKQEAKQSLHPGWLSVRMPQLVMGASACALMLRLSMVNMQGASGLAQDTYKFVAVSLTLASVCTALAQITQVTFGSFGQDGHMLLQLVQQASNIAWLHCALSLSDWGLMLTMPHSWSMKMHVGATAAVAYALVQCLKHKAMDTNWLIRPS